MDRTCVDGWVALAVAVEDGMGITVALRS